MFALQLLSEGGEGPNTELLWLIYVGISFFFLVIVAGWLSSLRKQPEVTPEPVHVEEQHEPAKADVAKPEKSQKETKSGRKK